MTTKAINTAKSTSFMAVLGYDRDVTYTIQSTNLGGVSLTPAEMPARFSNIPFPGDKAQFGDLSLRFLLDEDLSQWSTLNKWLFQLTEGIKNKNGDELISYIEVTVLNRQNQPTLRIRYNNAHVIDIGDLEYDIVGEEETLVSSASFTYSHYTIINATTGETIEYGNPQ
jgi:hypothetical protein